MTAIRGAESSDTQAMAEWLSTRSDAELVELLVLRPDLTVPIPQSMLVLAGRAEQRASVLRSADDFGTPVFAVIEALVLAEAHEIAAPIERVREIVGRPATTKVVDGALDQLRVRAMVWGEPDAVRLVPAAAGAVPWPIGRTVERPESMPESDVRAALTALPESERALLDRLANTAPIGRTRDAAPGTPADRPVQRLLSTGLLHWVDEQTVELPHEVGQILRGEPVTDPGSLDPPDCKPVAHKASDVNGAAAGEVLELLRHCSAVLEVLGDTPAPALRAGGMGVRELRRIGKITGVDEQRLSVVVEVLAAAGLIASGMPDPEPLITGTEEFWAPTIAFEAWREFAPAGSRPCLPRPG